MTIVLRGQGLFKQGGELTLFPRWHHYFRQEIMTKEGPIPYWESMEYHSLFTFFAINAPPFLLFSSFFVVAEPQHS